MKKGQKEEFKSTRIVGEARVAALVTQAAALKQDLAEAKEIFDQAKKQLIQIAKQRRGRFKTVLLEAPSVKAKVQFMSTVQWDTETLETAKTEIGSPKFIQYFRQETIYRPLRTVNKLMKEKGQTKIQRLIARAMRVKELAPKVSFEEVED